MTELRQRIHDNHSIPASVFVGPDYLTMHWRGGAKTWKPAGGARSEAAAWRALSEALHEAQPRHFGPPPPMKPEVVVGAIYRHGTGARFRLVVLDYGRHALLSLDALEDDGRVVFRNAPCLLPENAFGRDIASFELIEGGL